MNGYEVLLFLHVASVIVWLGTGSSLAVLALYGQRQGDRALLERLGPFGRWLGPRVFGPAAIGALVFGLALVADGHWTFRPLWIKLGLAAYAGSFLLNVGVRVPLMRRLHRPAGERRRDVRLLARLPVLELTVLYLAVADMLGKPSGADSGTLAAGAVILALASAPLVAGALTTPRAQEAPAR